MKNQLKIIGALISVLFALWLIGCGESKPSNVIKIGLAGPLTGDQADIGQDMNNGAIMAVDEWNEKGGVLGKKIELVSLDDRHDPKEAVAVAQRLVADPSVVAVIGHLNSGCSIPASKVYHQNKILDVTPCSTNPDLTLQGFPEIFRFCVTDALQGQFGADVAVKKMDDKRLAILHDKSQYGQGLAEQFRNTAEKDGAKILIFEGVTQGDKDFTAILTKIKGLNPQLIYFGGMYPEGSLITKQARDLGIKAAIMGGDGLNSGEFITNAGPASEGAYMTFLAPPWNETEQAKDFVAKYKEKFKRDVGPYAPFSYDAANCVLEAIQRANSTDRQAVIDAFRNTKDYKGITGVTNFDEHGDSTNKNMYLYVVKDGKFQLASI